MTVNFFARLSEKYFCSAVILKPLFSKEKSWVRVLFVQPNSVNCQNPERASTSPTQFN
jgi:hypothetical protein